MQVLKNILEEIKEVEKKFVVGHEVIFALGAIGMASEIKEIIRSHMNKKEKVTSAKIVSREIDGKTYYAIEFKEVGKDYYTVGYGSYKLDYVVFWLNECFEFCGEANVVVGDTKDTNNDWIPVEERLPNGKSKGLYDMNLVTLEDGEVCLGVYTDDKKEWRTRRTQGETIYTNKHNVIAWRPLPEPYKPKKDISAAENIL